MLYAKKIFLYNYFSTLGEKILFYNQKNLQNNKKFFKKVFTNGFLCAILSLA